MDKIKAEFFEWRVVAAPSQTASRQTATDCCARRMTHLAGRAGRDLPWGSLPFTSPRRSTARRCRSRRGASFSA
jgi:hypothetical protein